MKRLLIIFITILFVASAKADEPSRFSLNVGAFAPYTLEATAAYEHATGFGHSWVGFLNAGTHWQTPVCHMFWKKNFWGGGLGYRHRLLRMKNASFRVGGDVSCGAFVRRVTVGFDVLFEYNYTFANNWQFTLTQKNSFNFLHKVDTFRNGLMLGLKIPL